MVEDVVEFLEKVYLLTLNYNNYNKNHYQQLKNIYDLQLYI